nr:hypothetical protein CISIN_1g012904mg [Ipomoea batatas]
MDQNRLGHLSRHYLGNGCSWQMNGSVLQMLFQARKALQILENHRLLKWRRRKRKDFLLPLWTREFFLLLLLLREWSYLISLMAWMMMEILILVGNSRRTVKMVESHRWRTKVFPSGRINFRKGQTLLPGTQRISIQRRTKL